MVSAALPAFHVGRGDLPNMGWRKIRRQGYRGQEERARQNQNLLGVVALAVTCNLFPLTYVVGKAGGALCDPRPVAVPCRRPAYEGTKAFLITSGTL